MQDHTHNPPQRPYAAIAAGLSAAGLSASSTCVERMQAVVDALWDGLHTTGVSWVGFYLPAGAEQLVLGPRRDKAACSPIGLHGVCGEAYRRGQAVVVRDVADLGPNYIACDPRDRSEVVVPLFDAAGSCWAVLDVDSHVVGAFDECDAAGLTAVLRQAGLTV